MLRSFPLPRFFALAVTATWFLAGCSSKPPQPVRPDAAAVAQKRGAAVSYRYESLDEHEVSLEAMKGRATVLVFITTYEDASIIQARYLKKVFREHVPRINAAAIFMEPIENRPLCRIFRDAVGLPYSLAMADVETISGKGPFLGIDTVPSTVVLDLDGREAWRKVGVANPEELERAIKDAQSTVWGP